MGTRKANEQNIRNLTKNSSGTYSVTLPIAAMRKLGWREGQKVVIDQKGKSLIIKDWK